MKYTLFSVFFVLFGVALAQDQVILDGPCPDRPVQSGFDVLRYTGVWYEQMRYEDIFQLDGDCVTATYDLNEDGSVRVQNRLHWLRNQTSETAIGRAVLAFPNDPAAEARLNVTFFEWQPSANNYNVLSTDYNNYALVWGCQPLPNNQRKDNLWVLTRHPFIISSQVDSIINFNIGEYFDWNFVRSTRQGIICHGQASIF